MRRIVAAFAVWAILAPAGMQVAQAGEQTISFGRRALHRDWVAWAVGSDTNPLVDPTFCGEMVDGRFFLNLASVLDATYEDCQVPFGVKIVASSGYGIVWKPTDARSDRGLRRVLRETLEGFGGPRGRLDGQPLSLERAFARTGVYSIAVGPKSLIQTEDRHFPDDRTRTKVAAGAWVFRVVGLSVGDHRLVVRQRVFGQWARAVFGLVVT